MSSADRQRRPAPTSIGPYRVLQVIGEGGMGVVYEAEQLHPVRRRVAVKVMKAGMDCEQVVARFETERQALAVMKHPHIAHMLDAATTEDGRPYFVMERVHGEPITDYCDRHRLTTRERVRLFLQAASAIQHAHQKGVVHRDLKPSNMLVEVSDGRPVLKIIDFGIAKAVGVRLTDAAFVTRHGQIVGTPAYMSPEQAEGSELDVDTRTDIYSLGVVLYELLAGALPFDKRMFAKPDFVFQYLLRDTDAPTPSARFASLAETQITVARNRRTEVRALRRELRGDLDWVVMKAMEKDRTRRYETPQALGHDLERFLDCEPVEARPPTVAYRTSRFVRRHRLGVGSAAAIVTLLVGSSVALTVQASNLGRERDTAGEMATFLESLFEATDPYAGERRDTLNISQFVRLGAERVRSDLRDRPEVQARMFVVLGKVFRNLGRYDESRPLLSDALALYEQAGDADSREAVGTREILGFLERDMGDAKRSAATLEKVVAARRERGAPRELGTALMGLGNARQDLGEFDQAEAAYQEALDVLEAELGPDADKTMQALNNLATVRVRKGDYAGAEPAFRRALEAGRRSLGPDHPNTLSFANNLAFVLQDLKRLDEAEALYRDNLERARARFEAPSPEVARVLNNLGSVLLEQGDAAAAEPYLAEALDMRRAVYGPTHPSVAATLNNVASAKDRLGDFEGAEAAWRDALKILEATAGPSNPRVAPVLVGLGRLAHERGRHRDAVGWYRRAEAIRVATLGDTHPLTATLRIDLGRDLIEAGDTDAAQRVLSSSYRALQARGGEQEANLKLVLGYLLDLAARRGDGVATARFQAELAELAG